MSQEVEPSIVDYARFYGLIQDHLEDHPLHGLVAPQDLESAVEDGPDLVQIRLESVKVPVERLTIDAAAASLLASIAADAKDAPSREDEELKFDTHRVRRMKHELPLLRSDPEVDQLHFAPRLVPDLEHELLPLETIDQEADEGFDWPTRYYDLPEEYFRKLKSEKLEVQGDALVFLQEALTSHLEGGEHQAFEDVELPYSRKTKEQPISPPLLHMSPVTLPFVPSSDTGRIELLSDHASPTRDELREAERLIFDQDGIVPKKKTADSSSQNSDPMLLDAESLGNIYSPLKGLADPPSSPPSPRYRLGDRKVEVPLSPMRPDQSAPWNRKSVSFSEALTEVIQDLPPPIPKPENVSSDDIDAIFDEVIRPIGIKAERSIEQEKLQEADTTLRVTVPVMDFSLPVAPWKANGQRSTTSDKDQYKQTLFEMKKLHFNNHAWALSGRLERELTWTPFPAALGKVENQEKIADDGLIEEYLAPPDRVDIEKLTWKPDGLRILDDLAESEDELEEGTFPEERDLVSLIRKRKFVLEEGEDEHEPPESTQDKQGAVPIPRGRVASQAEPPVTQGATFSALSELNKYMNLRKGQAETPQLIADRYFTNVPTETVQKHSPTATTMTKFPPPVSKAIPLPSPSFTVPTTTIPFVVSASFLSNRKLSRQIHHLFPTADFIERDFNLYLDPPQNPSKKHPHPNAMTKTTLADEADIIISPSTGLIWTTLQKIKQRSLSGQTTRSPVRDRIMSATPRYERLLLMVSEDRHIDNSIDHTHPDESDCQALIELIAFTSGLETDVQVTFVAGGMEDLAHWIVAMMVNYCVTDTDVKLIQDETLWEVFLRRAGLNAFAAQAILADLKAPEHGDGGGGDFGLAAFLKMSVEERLAKFEILLGGRRVLGRVSRVLDARW